MKLALLLLVSIFSISPILSMNPNGEVPPNKIIHHLCKDLFKYNLPNEIINQEIKELNNLTINNTEKIKNKRGFNDYEKANYGDINHLDEKRPKNK